MGLSQRRHSDERERPLIRPVVEPFDTFVHAESSGGLLLLGATVVAMVWANLPWAGSYAGLLWLALLLSGVQATIAGVLAAMTIPACTRVNGSEFVARGQALLKRLEVVTSADRPPLANAERHRVTQRLEMEDKDVETPLQRLEHALHPWVTVVVMPLFALANAGITLDANGGGPI